MYDGLAIMLLGQQLWLKELESYITYPPMQDAETYNLGQVLQEVKKNARGPSGRLGRILIKIAIGESSMINVRFGARPEDRMVLKVL